VNRIVRPAGLALACACLAWSAGPGGAQSLYSVKDLGSLGGSVAGALSVNRDLVAVGHSFLPGNSALHAFIDDGSGMRDLGTLGGPQAQARSVNASGDVVGWADVEGSTYHAFLWRGGSMRDLGTLGGTTSDARWVNAAGDVVGSSMGPDDAAERAFLWRDGVLTDLGTLGGTDARAYCVNDLGDIVGFARVAANNDLHACLWRQGMLTDLGTLGGWASHAYAINNSGKICGWSMKVPNYVSHAFVWSEGVSVDLGTFGGVYSAAFDLNSDGTAVGTATDPSGAQRAFVWDGTRITDLNRLIPANGGWTLTAAYGINDDGVIVGVGTRSDGTRAFLLVPDGSSSVPRAEATLAFGGPTPNPAHGSAVFDFTLTRSGPVRLELFDVSGRRVRTLVDGDHGPGTARVAWDGADERGAAAPAGMYFARFAAESRVMTRRFTRTR
jgi:probable HAF family extracellular repeat protein